MLRHGDAPYWNHSAYTNAVKSQSDIVIIMLGTNDAKRNNWAQHGSEYADDYAAMVDSFRSAKPDTQVWSMVPLPLYMDGRYNMNQTVLVSGLPVQTVLPTIIRFLAYVICCVR